MMERIKKYVGERMEEPSVPLKLMPVAAWKIVVYALFEHPRHPLTPARLIWDANRNFATVVKGEK